MLERSIHIKIDRFDGSLGLLLSLIQENEMEIKDLELCKITEQYLQYLSRMQELNFNIAGDYLYLASTLCFLKSQSCIEDKKPSLVEEDDPLNITSELELKKRLEELQHFQEMGRLLWTLPRLDQDFFVRKKMQRKKIVNNLLSPVDLEKLTYAMISFLSNQSRKSLSIKKDDFSMKTKLHSLKSFFIVGTQTDLYRLIDDDSSRKNIIITLLLLLELARLKRIQIFQNKPYENIFIKGIDTVDECLEEHIDEFTYG